MRAVVIENPGGPEVLKLREVPDPVPAAGEVLISIIAAGINRADLAQRQGFYPPPPGAPPYPGMECAGRITAVGAGRHRLAARRRSRARCWRAAATPSRSRFRPARCCRIPAGVSLRDAAALPEVACTVYSNVVMYGRARGRGDAARARRLQRHRHDGDPARPGARRHGSPARPARPPSSRAAASSARISPSTITTRISPPPCSSSPAAAEPTSSSTSWVRRTCPGTSLRWQPAAAWSSSACRAACEGELDLGQLLRKRATVHAADPALPARWRTRRASSPRSSRASGRWSAPGRSGR